MVSARSVAAAMWSSGELEATGRCFDPRGEQEGVGPVRAGAASPAASSAARIRCAPRLSPSTTQAQPNPLTMASASSGSCSMLHAQRGVDVGALGPGEGEMLGLVAAAHTWRGGCGRVGEPGGVGGEGALGQSGVGHRFERESRGCCRAAGSGRSSRRRRRRRSPANGWRAGRRRRSRRRPVRRAPRGRTRPRRAVRRRRRWPAPTGLAGRRGTAGRSSIRSST